MNLDRIQGNWKLLKGNVKVRWGRLIGDQFVVFSGKRDQVDGKTQVVFSHYQDEAKKQLSSWKG